MIAITPTAALATTPPAVGIFWLMDGVLVIDRSTLEEAEVYGDCLTHAAGHYERWQKWQAGAAAILSMGYPKRILSTEYDDWPRGRIVYEIPAQRFVLYADRRLQKPVVIDALKTAFGFNSVQVIIRSDPHYR